MFFEKFTVGSRLIIAFGVILALSFITALISLSKLSSIQADLEDIVKVNNVKVEINNNMVDAVHIVSRVIRSIVLLQDKSAKDTEFKKIEKAREDYDVNWTALQKFPPSDTGKAIRQRTSTAKDAARQLNDRVLKLAFENTTEEAVKLLLDEANPATEKWQAAINENVVYQKISSAKQFDEAEAYYKDARLILITANLVNFILSIVLGFLVTRSITKQLGGEPNDAVALTRSISSGDLTSLVQLKQGDTNSLLANLTLMQDSLVAMVGNVRCGAESVSSASAEIASGNHDLSSRTEQQASALEETAASMEELSSTVMQNADGARRANSLAHDASAVAQKGGEVVNQAVSTMKKINDSSQKIADIIGVIDGIAFQTNILALNAAVEAARAGEQGKGFAVVASEVRSLAGRSAEAAKEIKKLITESVERVNQGTTLVNQAGITMGNVVDSIQQVTTLMEEISSASSQQAEGVAQVGEAVGQMDQATQQNAALVEEMAAAASSLKSQALELVQVVSVFKLIGDKDFENHGMIKTRTSLRLSN